MKEIKMQILIFITFLGCICSFKITKKDIDKLCSGVKFKELNVNKNTTIQGFIKSLDIDEDKHKFFVDFLINNKIPSKDDIPKELMVFLVLIIFIPITILTWIIFWFCHCCHCCLFKKEDASTTKKVTIFFITVAIYAGVIIASIVSFSTSSSFVDDLKGFTCNFGKFYYHTISGEESEQAPRWIGLEYLADLSKNTSKEIKNIQDNQGICFEGLDSLNNLAKNYSTSIEKAIKFSDIMVPSPNSKENNIKPLYSYQFEDSENTYISKIKNEFTENITIPLAILNKFKDQSSEIIEKAGSLTKSMEEISDKASSFENAINEIGEKTFTTINDYKDTADKGFYAFFKVLFGMFIAFAVLLLTILSLYSCCRFSCFKVLIHIMWNLLLLFIILAFVVAILFGLLSEASLQIAPAVSEIMTYDFLVNNEKFHIGETPAKLLETCINKDGNLAEAMNISFETSDEIEKMFYAIDNLTNIKNQLDSLTKSKALNESYNGILEYENDYTKITNNTYSQNDVQQNLDYLSKLTNNLSICGTLDVYVFNISKCPSDYYYKTKENYTKGEKNCLLVQNYTAENISELYNSCTEHKDEIIEKYTNISYFYEKNKEQLEEIKKHLIDMDTNYDKIIFVDRSLKQISEDAIKLGNNFRNLFKDLISKDGLSEIFNCNYIKKDLIRFMKIIFDDFHGDCQSICAGTFVAAIFSYIGLFFLMVSLYRHKQKGDEEDESKEKLNNDGTNIQMQSFNKH